MFLSSFTMVVRIDFTGNRLYTTNTSQCWTWERLYNLWKSSKGIGREILTVMFQHLRASLIEGTKSEPHSSMLWTASKFTCKSWSIHDSKPTARPQDVKKSTKFQAKKGNLDQVEKAMLIQCFASMGLFLIQASVRFLTVYHLFTLTPLDMCAGRSLARSWFWRGRICSETSHNTGHLATRYSYRIPSSLIWHHLRQCEPSIDSHPEVEEDGDHVEDLV